MNIRKYKNISSVYRRAYVTIYDNEGKKYKSELKSILDESRALYKAYFKNNKCKYKSKYIGIIKNKIKK